ncbi:MAG: hypothetical protein ACYDH6_13775 [Acidimicrobiales bacterium]
MLLLNRACQCGSGRRARDCCGRFRHLSSEEVAQAYLSRQARQARDVVGPFSTAAVAALQTEAATLPERCALFSDALVSTRHVRRGVDTPTVRAALVKATIALREAGAVDEHLAAATIIDLTQPSSAVCDAAMAEAAARRRTPGPSPAVPSAALTA